jgi:hypothetical protein
MATRFGKLHSHYERNELRAPLYYGFTDEDTGLSTSQFKIKISDS